MARGSFPTRPDIVSCLSGYVRAPGEADGQLASMYHLDMVTTDAVASLDGDVVAHNVGVILPGATSMLLLREEVLFYSRSGKSRECAYTGGKGDPKDKAGASESAPGARTAAGV